MYKWYKSFHEGCTNTDDDLHNGCSATASIEENIEHIHQIVQAYRQHTINNIASQVHLQLFVPINLSIKAINLIKMVDTDKHLEKTDWEWDM